MRINVAIPEAHVDAPVLDAALESVTRLNESLLRRKEVPPFERGLRYGVRWKPEPPGDEHFDSADRVLRRRWGDCDDLAPWHAASLRDSGEDPGARAIVRRSGPRRWHAVVQRSDGTIDDPSRRAGMGQHHSGVVGAALPLMLPSSVVGGAYIVRPQIAVRPVRGQMQARADLPWHWREHLSDPPSGMDWAMTALHTAPVASTALVGAIDAVCQLGAAAGFADDDHLARLQAIADACEGADRDELAEIYGDEHAEAAEAVVGSLFGKIAKGLKKVAKTAVMPIAANPLLSKAVAFVPGIGPVASMALDAASGSGLLKGAFGGGGGGGGGRAPAAQPITAAPGVPGAAATYGGRLRPEGVELLRALIFA